MPRRDDIKSICVLGAGPIVIGQACEFDYSGTQACKALRAEGYHVVLVNSNPATIMTDPSLADATYIEPLTPEVVTRILEKERPDAVLPTLGGQTALNLALALDAEGVLERLGIEMLGASVESIRLAEDRELFKGICDELGLEAAKSGLARSMSDAEDIVQRTGIPCILRPSFTLGGVGGGTVQSAGEFAQKMQWALDASPVSEVLVEESLLGWKEFEMEVVRDTADHVIIICSIENFDPMGVHTGDSITVAPAQTLTDREYQAMRNASMALIRRVGVSTGGCNIQFAIDPATSRMVVIEMNPRVSRSSALASKATGFPIAKVAALLAVGYRLDELRNDITGTTSACFEPSLDYVVTKMPRFAFEKFAGASSTLGTQMKSVGEVMGIGRDFGESLLKALRSIETQTGSLLASEPIAAASIATLEAEAIRPNPHRLWICAELLRRGHSVEQVHALSHIDPWYLHEVAELVAAEGQIVSVGPALLKTRRALHDIKRMGFSDDTIAQLLGVDSAEVRNARHELDVHPSYLRVDTCAAEFEASTPYMYSSWESVCESDPDSAKKVLIIGSGPNRIGQGIEFDYSCVKAAWAAKDAGLVSIMVNCNPETVSTDHDTSDRLYFEPLDLESVLSIVRIEKPVGVIVQLGGQTPLRLAAALDALGVPILGTSSEMIEAAENRAHFSNLAKDVGFRVPEHFTAMTADEAHKYAETLGFPILVRPSHVLGGRGMAILGSTAELEVYLTSFFHELDTRALPLLIDRFLNDAIEVDVDALSDGEHVVIGGVMEQIERAGVHSGDSSCILPPATLDSEVVNEMKTLTRKIAVAMKVVGLINIQFAVTQDAGGASKVYVLEVNPRASRTVPFVSKAVGTCMSEAATHLMLGATLPDLGLTQDLEPIHVAAKVVVTPWSRFPGASMKPGPEMRSTGEVMGQGHTPEEAYVRAMQAASLHPASGAWVTDSNAHLARTELTGTTNPNEAVAGLMLADGAVVLEETATLLNLRKPVFTDANALKWWACGVKGDLSWVETSLQEASVGQASSKS